ncbi:fungal-specific transcription factor domain-containing protein [Neurospora hispaniola]|uniref:Fungal-specific transcription factor domain-containing protein n=1 Tax=Neurospora hispaniola TaxID=588809 RepID=A0AAJ0MP34_9PEZI|nr:fungal-specific transcription factor domain-containing protein [Neurospora hispaniola]
MAPSSANPPDTMMVSETQNNKPTNAEETAGGATAGVNSSTPKQKRLACEICRRRKLKCDGTKPSCSTCSRLGHVCAYDERRKKSGPKKGHLKALAERLKQVETLLKTQEAPRLSADGNPIAPNIVDGSGLSQPSQHAAAAAANFNVPGPSRGMATEESMDQWQFHGDPSSTGLDDFNLGNNLGLGMSSIGGDFTWEMIGLGLEEPLPPQETIDELQVPSTMSIRSKHQVYFDKIHPSLPMIHRARYFHAMNLAPNQRPPVCLRYAMWTLACSVSDRFLDLKELFYQRARKYLELDTIKGFGEHMITVSHCQTYVLLASYEFKWMYFPRAWMSIGSAVRLCQMMGLYRVDGGDLEVKQCLPPPRDWTEKEERRRTFWMAFCQDRYASIGTGWPMIIDEKDILTDLPASDEAYDLSHPQETQSLNDVTLHTGPGKLSSFGGVILLAYLFGRNLIHLHRPTEDDRDDDLNGEFWKRHRQMDNILLNVSLCIPSALKLPQGLANPNVVFTNMCIHTSTICLHQAAIFKADTNNLPASVSTECKMRCITSAHEIASIMRMASHLDLDRLNPNMSFCLYVAARVFVQFLKSRPDDGQVADSLRFLLSAMNALKRKNPLTESFVVQLDVDLEALGAKVPKLKNAFSRSNDGHTSRAHMKPGTGLGASTTHGNMYHQECQFLRTVEDDGNPVNAPNLVEPVDLDDPLVQLPGSSRNTAPDWSSSVEQRSPIPSAGGQHGGGSARTGGLAFATSIHGRMPNNISLAPNYQTRPPRDPDTGGNSDGVPLSTPSPNSNQPTPNSGTSSSNHHHHLYHQMHQHQHPHHHPHPHPRPHAYHQQEPGQGQVQGLAPTNDGRHMSGSGGSSSSMSFDNSNNNHSTSPITPGSSTNPTITTAATALATTATTTTSTALDINPCPAAAVGFFLDPTAFGMPGVEVAPENTTNSGLARTASDHHANTIVGNSNNGSNLGMGSSVGMGMNIGVGSDGGGGGMTPNSVLRSLMAMGNMEGMDGMEGCGMDLGWGNGGTSHGLDSHGNRHGGGGSF